MIRPKVGEITNIAAHKILCFLHFEHAYGDRENFDIGTFTGSITTHKKNILERAISKLRREGLVFEYLDSFSNDESLAISDEGIEAVESWSDEYYTEIANGIEFISSPYPTYLLPASNRKVTLTDNQAKEATQAIDTVIQEFRKDHHFDNEWSKEKGVLLEALEAGKDYIAKKVIDVQIAATMTVDKLKVIVAKYKDAGVSGTVSALAQKAIDTLIEIFKSALN